MDDNFGYGLTIGLVLALLVGLFSYNAAQTTVRDQAVAAQVACYKVPEMGGTVTFQWNCTSKAKSIVSDLGAIAEVLGPPIVR